MVVDDNLDPSFIGMKGVVFHIYEIMNQLDYNIHVILDNGINRGFSKRELRPETFNKELLEDEIDEKK